MSSMNIGIIGAGFTGLSAALELQKKGHNVTLFEKESIPGGLAIGFQAPSWEWPLEKHYHHIFATDKDIRQIAEEVGVDFTFTYPNTSWLLDEEIFQIDSPIKLLQFKKLNIIDRIRMGAVLGLFKVIPDGTALEKYTAAEWLPKMMGQKVYKMFWEPLLIAKFGSYASTISLAWFWARIKARTMSLGYPQGGFQHLADMMGKRIVEQKGEIHYGTTVTSITKEGDTITVKTTVNETYKFDKVIVTLPNFFFEKMAPQLPQEYRDKLLSFKGIGAVNMVLELNKPFFKENVYWLSICDTTYPFLAVVEHTNFVDKKHYNGHNLVYVGNYLQVGHEYFSLTDEELLQRYDAHLRKFNPDYKESLVATHVFKVPFAQPVVPTNFSKKIMPFETPVEGIYLANMQQVYPWDRGTNYAVEMGKRVATLFF